MADSQTIPIADARGQHLVTAPEVLRENLVAMGEAVTKRFADMFPSGDQPECVKKTLELMKSFTTTIPDQELDQTMSLLATMLLPSPALARDTF